MTDEIIVIDAAAPGAEAMGTLEYLAVLIYPGSPAKRDRFVTAALAYGVRVCRRHGLPEPAWASEVLIEVKQRDQATRLQAAQRILLRRLQAGRALQSVILERCSLTAAAKRSGGNRAHFLHAAWAESLPVLHLSWALLTTARSPATDRRPLLLSLIARADWLPEAARQSESKLTSLMQVAALPEFATQLARYLETPKVRVNLHCAYSPTG